MTGVLTIAIASHKAVGCMPSRRRRARASRGFNRRPGTFGKLASPLRILPWNKLHAGSSEILNWVAIAGALEGLRLDWFEYVPGYRTPAGTGTGLSFATWS